MTYAVLAFAWIQSNQLALRTSAKTTLQIKAISISTSKVQRAGGVDPYYIRKDRFSVNQPAPFFNKEQGSLLENLFLDAVPAIGRGYIFDLTLLMDLSEDKWLVCDRKGYIAIVSSSLTLKQVDSIQWYELRAKNFLQLDKLIEYWLRMAKLGELKWIKE